jgi:hypothetical protein
MAQDGDYPFIVIVWNRFTSPSDPTVNVQFNHFPNAVPAENIKDWLNNRTDPLPGDTYSIKPGDRLGFPLYWGPELDDGGNETSVGENLVITLVPAPGGETAPETPYYLWLGPLASYTLKDRRGELLSTGGGSGYTCIKHSIGGQSSGIWTITDPSLQWTLTVKKLVPDPETTNVSIGPDIP